MRGNRLAILAFAVMLIAASWDISMYTEIFYDDRGAGAAPASPAANKLAVYGRNGELCSKNSGGTETCMSAGGGGGGNGFGTIGNAIADAAADAITVTDSASIDFTTTDGPEDITAVVLPAGVTLTGDIDGAANANDLDEVNVEVELEGVMDLLDLQDGSASPCGASQEVRRNGTDTAFECYTFTDDDVPEAGDFGALALTGPVTSTGLATAIAGDTITDAMVVNTVTASNYLPLAGGTLTGNLVLSGDASEGVSGGGLSDCDDPTNSKILWDVTTNKFSCGTDQGGGGGGLSYAQVSAAGLAGF